MYTADSNAGERGAPLIEESAEAGFVCGFDQNCVGSDQQPTHARVEQSVVVAPATATATALYNLLREEFERHPYNYKIIGKRKTQ